MCVSVSDWNCVYLMVHGPIIYAGMYLFVLYKCYYGVYSIIEAGLMTDIFKNRVRENKKL